MAGNEAANGATSVIRRRPLSSSSGGIAQLASPSLSQGAGSSMSLTTNAVYPSTRNMTDMLNASDELFNFEDRTNIANRVRKEGQRQLESARTREQQEANFPYQNWNLAQNNPRGNLNRMSYGDTLRYSRLADMLNNQFHYRPGHQTNVYVGGRGFEKSADSASVSRWEPIETEEMRQMAANRRLDEKARGAQVDLQARIEAYPQAVQEAKDEAMRKMWQFISERDIQFYQEALQKMITEEYGGSWRAFYQAWNERFIKELELETGVRIWNAGVSMTPNYFQLWLSVMRIGAVVPDYMESLFEQVTAQRIKAYIDAGMPEEQALAMVRAEGEAAEITVADIAEKVAGGNTQSSTRATPRPDVARDNRRDGRR